MSPDAQFKDFVERQQQLASANVAHDWNKERDEWLKYLQKLYDLIAEYLHKYIDNGTIKLRESIIDLNEENIGAYKAKRLVIVIGAQEILLTPIGTLLIGSKGRVDVEGSAGNSRLVLINKRVTHAKQMFHVTTATILPGGRSVRASKEVLSPNEIEWVWKIVSRPPAMQFVELNKETLFEMLMEVANG